ncbi:hypothetical protein VB780_15765 [Leptolyngbya sp. CCNP1308]|uniref:hypothetical protein n=1 Tax=Leptolyngbya sp. CCNP1308 TaxID=3110255 RepID=UPI002B205819|nr:hypothetical protein [Leptolyngbya sp. CCNP1308]MEA5450038.1 hypothetical protein [Leptolyngbya sp. CCNP1308]
MSSSTNRELQPPEAQPPSLFDRIFRDDAGNIVIGQPPNLIVLVAVAATVLQTVLSGGLPQAAADLVAFGAWFTWAWQELFEGVNYFRRAIGLVTLVGLLVLKLSLA